MTKQGMGGGLVVGGRVCVGGWREEVGVCGREGGGMEGRRGAMIVFCEIHMTTQVS